MLNQVQRRAGGSPTLEEQDRRKSKRCEQALEGGRCLLDEVFNAHTCAVASHD
jgi:hypothetical protein